MNAKMKGLQATIASLSTELKPLVAKNKSDGLTDDEGTKYDELIAQLNVAGEDLAKETERYNAGVKAEDAIKGATEPMTRELVQPPATHAKSLGQLFTQSPSYQAGIKSGLERPLIEYRADRMSELDGEKALIYSGTPSASMLLPQVLPTWYRGMERTSGIRQVLGAMRTDSDAVTVLRENVFTNNAAEVAEATAVNEGAKPESAITFTEETALVQNIAHWIPITRRVLEDIPFMESYVDGRLRDGLERRVANQLINGDGTAPNISGLLDQSTLTVANNAYFAGAPVSDAGTDNENPNRIRRAKRLVRTTGLAVPTFILANPADVEKWETLTDTQGNYLFGGPAVNGMVGRMWGLPVIEDEYIAAGTAVVGDGSMAAVVDRTDAMVLRTDSHSDFFIRNIFVLLAECRLTLAVFRPAAFVVVTLV